MGNKTKTFRRRRKLIEPGIQLRLILTFVGISALALLLQFVLFANSMTSLALALPQDSELVLEKTGDLLLEVLFISFAIFLPMTFAIGVLCTFRIAGPIYRFKTFLSQVERGERPEDFSLRSGDELKDLARLINSVTAPLRAGDGHSAQESSAAHLKLTREEEQDGSPGRMTA